VAVAALVAAGTLFALRYGVRRSLDLRPPISEALVEFFRPSPEMAKAWDQADQAVAEPEKAAADAAGQRSEGEGERGSESDELTPVEPPRPDGEALPPADGRSRLPDDADRPAGNESDASAGDGPAADDRSEPPPNANTAETPPDGAQQTPKFPQPEESDLIRKMEDAFAKLLSRLKIEPEGGERRRAVRSRRSERSSGRRSERESMESSRGENMAATQRQGRLSQDGAQQARSGQRQSQGPLADQPGKKGAQSGVGKKEGSKDVELARQLEAMGKLAEILGQRNKNLKGDVMVEVSSGDQRLRTAYTETGATHRAAGSEIHRDEVPLVLREYVEKYFEEVRKQPPAVAPEP